MVNTTNPLLQICILIKLTNKNHWLSSVTDTKAIKIGEHLT